MADDLSDWTPRQKPRRRHFEGRHVRLEPLDIDRHFDGLLAASQVPDAAERFRYLAAHPPASKAELRQWMERAVASDDPLHFAVVDRASGCVLGRQAFMRIDCNSGVIEIGDVYWGPGLSRSAGATEAFHLFAAYVFDALGYRRFEWKCNDRNLPSKRAAERFGFSHEGLFRQHMVVKGLNRDTAWFAMLDGEWPVIGAALRCWLEPGNFDKEGRQKKRLEEFRRESGQRN